MFIGFDECHGYAHMYRAILEGIAFRMKQNMSAMESERGIHIKSLVVSGGGSYSDPCMQIFADVFDLPVVRNEVRNAAGLGAAICAAVACGIYPDFNTASTHMIRQADRFEPDPETVELYAQLRAVYADISAQTDVILERTHQILSDHKGVMSHVHAL